MLVSIGLIYLLQNCYWEAILPPQGFAKRLERDILVREAYFWDSLIVITLRIAMEGFHVARFQCRHCG